MTTRDTSLPTTEAGALAILADDLTGACDSSVPFARLGFATRVLLSPGPVAASVDPADVIAVDADSRQVSQRLAVHRTTLSARALRAPGTTRLFKKVDSTLRGHVGPEILACMRAWETPLAILCPAFPATGRWVQGGEVFVDGRGSLGAVAALAGLPADRRTGHLSLTTLRAGADAVCEQLATLARGGARVVVADADTPGHLTTLVEAASAFPSPVLLAGAGGLAAALAAWTVEARRLGAASSSAPPAAADPDAGPPWLVVVGSQTEVTQHQVVELARAGAEVIPLDVDELLSRSSVALGAGRRAAALLRDDVTPILRLVVPPGC